LERDEETRPIALNWKNTSFAGSNSGASRWTKAGPNSVMNAKTRDELLKSRYGNSRIAN
jgi:hypothetical protein